MLLVLLCFNDADTLTFAEIERQTGIPSDHLTASLLGLAHPSVAALDKKPKTLTVEPDHQFRINPKFASKAYRTVVRPFKTAAVMQKEQEAVHEEIEHMRKLWYTSDD